MWEQQGKTFLPHSLLLNILSKNLIFSLVKENHAVYA